MKQTVFGLSVAVIGLNLAFVFAGCGRSERSPITPFGNASRAVVPSFNDGASFALEIGALPQQDAAADAKLLKEKVVSAEKSVRQISEFIQFFGVEVLRETNLVEDGKIEGNLESGKKGIKLGDVMSLAKGILGTEAAGISKLAPFDGEAVPLDKALGNVFTGLASLGFGSGALNFQLSGSLNGKFEGRGQQINNAPHLFTILTKDEKRLTRALEDISKFESDCNLEAKKATVSAENCSILKGSAAYMKGVLASDRIPTTALVAAFETALSDFRKNVTHADQLIARNIDSKEVIFTNAREVVRDLKAWMSTKRVTTQMIGGQVQHYLDVPKFKMVYNVRADYQVETRSPYVLFAHERNWVKRSSSIWRESDLKLEAKINTVLAPVVEEVHTLKLTFTESSEREDFIANHPRLTPKMTEEETLSLISSADKPLYLTDRMAQEVTGIEVCERSDTFLLRNVSYVDCFKGDELVERLKARAVVTKVSKSSSATLDLSPVKNLSVDEFLSPDSMTIKERRLYF